MTEIPKVGQVQEALEIQEEYSQRLKRWHEKFPTQYYHDENLAQNICKGWLKMRRILMDLLDMVQEDGCACEKVGFTCVLCDMYEVLGITNE